MTNSPHEPLLPDIKTREKRLKRLALVLVLGVIAPLIDTTVVNVALPKLGGALHTTLALSQWTIIGYLLAMGIVIPLSGWLLERLGGKKLWLLALGLFLVGSVLAGLSWNIESMIFFRVLQGTAAGIISPLMTTLMLRDAHEAKVPIGGIMTTASLPIVVVPIFGPVIAGLILAHLDWRWIFFVNVPIVIAAFLLAWWKQPEERPSPVKHRFDILGFIQLAPALALIFYGLSHAAITHSFNDSSVYLPIIAGLVLAACFVVYSWRTPDPLIDVKAVRVRAYAASLAILFLSGLSLYGPPLLISLFFQTVQHRSILMTGLLLAPQGLGSLFPRLFVNKVIDKIGPRPVILSGTALMILGVLPFAFATASTSQWILSASLFALGFGLTPVFIAVMVGAFQGLPKNELANASSTTRIIQQVGGSFGTAVLTVILTSALTSHAIPAEAFNIAFRWSLALSTLILIPTLLLPKFVKEDES